MKLDLFRTMWGLTSPLASYAEKMKAEGFVGVEARIPQEPNQFLAFKRDLKDWNLDYIAILFSGGDVIPKQSETSGDHLIRMEQLLGSVAELQPVFINVLAGNDRWSIAEQVDFFSQAIELSKKYDVICSFETHRGTSLYSPWLTLDLIRQVPDMKFTMDLSHWVLVCERLLNDPLDNLTPFVNRVHHVQARIGYDQGPQVPHPGAPEFSNQLGYFQAMWESVWNAHITDNRETTTMTTEFGPDGYLHHLPFSNVPVADLWALNQWMAAEERRHFDTFITSKLK